MYSLVCTRPNLSYAASLISRFMPNPSKENWRAVKWVLRYIRRTSGFGLVYRKNEECAKKLVGYCDADFCGDLDKRRSLIGYYFLLFRNVIS